VGPSPAQRLTRSDPGTAGIRRRRCGLGFRYLGRDRVLAAAVRLIDLGFFRPGGEEYAEENGSFWHGQTIAAALVDLGKDSDFGDLATRGRAERRAQPARPPGLTPAPSPGWPVSPPACRQPRHKRSGSSLIQSPQ